MIPELSILIAIVALVVTSISCLFVWWARRDMRMQLNTVRQEQKAVNSAIYGLARHLRRIQIELDQSSSPTDDDGVSFSKADELVDKGLDTLQIADELGLSQSEAEIITHLPTTCSPVSTITIRVESETSPCKTPNL